MKFFFKIIYRNPLCQPQSKEHKFLHLRLCIQVFLTFPAKCAVLIILHAFRIMKAHLVYQRGSPQAKSPVVLTLPVSAVMAAFESLPGIIRNLISPIAFRFQYFLCIIVHLAFLVLRRKESAWKPFLPALDVLGIFFIKRRPFFHNQAVSRNMLRLQLRDLLQRFPPCIRALPRKRRHQVNIDILKSRFPCHPVALQKCLPCMDSPQRLQFRILCRLQPQAQPVNARLLPIFQFFPI